MEMVADLVEHCGFNLSVVAEAQKLHLVVSEDKLNGLDQNSLESLVKLELDLCKEREESSQKVDG